MANPRVPLRLLLFLAALLLLPPACKVEDDVVDEIGVTRIFFVDPTLLGQVITDEELPIVPPDERVQAAEWEIQTAMLTVGPDTFDMTAGETCQIVDIRDLIEDIPDPDVFLIPITVGRCARGIVFGATTEPVPAVLDLIFTMTVTREAPTDVPVGSDNDGDLVNNENDNCPLVSNAASDCDNDPMTPDEQCDSNGDGIGDACTTAGLLDSDGDGLPDGFDNCVGMANPGQEGGLVGDACEEQRANVELGGSQTLRIQVGPFDFSQPLERGSFVVVDVSSQEFSANCDWGNKKCPLQPSQVRACVAFDTVTALGGC